MPPTCTAERTGLRCALVYRRYAPQSGSESPRGGGKYSCVGNAPQLDAAAPGWLRWLAGAQHFTPDMQQRARSNGEDPLRGWCEVAKQNNAPACPSRHSDALHHPTCICSIAASLPAWH